MKLLFDCHIAKAALAALRKTSPMLQAEHLATWRTGAFLRADDASILTACHSEQRAFVTYDLATIPDLLRQWAAEDRDHSGVVFADANTVSPDVPAQVAAAVAALAAEIGDSDTRNMVRFLRPVRK